MGLFQFVRFDASPHFTDETIAELLGLIALQNDLEHHRSVVQRIFDRRHQNGAKNEAEDGINQQRHKNQRDDGPAVS